MPGSSFLAPSAYGAATNATSAKANYADSLRKALDSNRALNPNSRPNTLPTGQASATSAGGLSTISQQNQIKNAQGQQASQRTTQIVQNAANQKKAVAFAQASTEANKPENSVGLSQQEPNQDYSNYQVGDSNSARSTLVKNAMGLIGTGYAWGGGGYGNRSSRGTGLGTQNVIGVDCSGLTSYAYSTLGIRIPRTAAGQKTIGYKTAVKNLRPGDLVVWASGKHTSMYIGNGQIVESPRPGLKVRVRTLTGKEPVVGVHLSLSGD